MSAHAIANPLHDLHQQAEAEFQPYDQIEIVSTFGEPQAEYAAIHKGAALMDLPQRGILELTGKDRLDFLNRFLTNKTWDKEAKSGLKAGEGVYAFLLNNKGRVVADFNVLEQGDRTLLEMDGRLVEQIRTTFEKYLFTEQVKIASRASDLHEIALHGPTARDALSQVLVSPLPDLPPQGSAQAILLDTEAILWRDDPCGVPGYHLILPLDAARRVWVGLLSRFATPDLAAGNVDPAPKRRLRPIGWAAFNAARIEAGRPLFGIDFDDSVLPAETSQVARAVSFTKGCYLGQEIVARMHARGQVARQLVGIKTDEGHLPIAGVPVYDDKDNQVGGVTSSTLSPILSNAAICLAYVKKPFTPVGTKVIIPAEGSMRPATVVDLPFYKG